MISNGKTKLHELLKDKNIEKWIKYSFIPDSASPKKKYNKKSESESDEDEDDDNELQDKEDINYKGIEYARN